MSRRGSLAPVAVLVAMGTGCAPVLPPALAGRPSWRVGAAAAGTFEALCLALETGGYRVSVEAPAVVRGSRPGSAAEVRLEVLPRGEAAVVAGEVLGELADEGAQEQRLAGLVAEAERVLALWREGLEWSYQPVSGEASTRGVRLRLPPGDAHVGLSVSRRMLVSQRFRGRRRGFNPTVVAAVQHRRWRGAPRTLLAEVVASALGTSVSRITVPDRPPLERSAGGASGVVTVLDGSRPVELAVYTLAVGEPAWTVHLVGVCGTERGPGPTCEEEWAGVSASVQAEPPWVREEVLP